MAIALEFIDFIVPIHVIRQKYSGRWEQCLKDHERLIGGRVWFDEHLLRDGAIRLLRGRIAVRRPDTTVRLA